MDSWRRIRKFHGAKRYVSCYSSKDLAHWTFRNQVIKLADPENFGRGWVLERPKVYYNEKTNKVYQHQVAKLPGFGPVMGGSMTKVAYDYLCKK